MVNYDHLPADSACFNGKLYQKMLEDLQLAGMSQRTVHGYLRAVRQLADWAGARPNKITEAQLRKYFLYLKNEKQFAYGSIRVAFSGINKHHSDRAGKRDHEQLISKQIHIYDDFDAGTRPRTQALGNQSSRVVPATIGPLEPMP